MNVALSVNGQFLDLTDSSVPTMTYPGVSGLGQVKGAGSDTITIPFTERNRQIFGDISDLNAVLETTPAFADTIPCVLHYEGNEFLQGRLVITGWNDDQIQAQFLSSAANWAEVLDRPLKDVNQGVGGTLEARWQATYNVCDWLTSPGRTGKIDPFETHTWIATAYGYKDGFAGAPDPNTGLLFSEQRPAAFVYPLLYAHFQQAGYTLVSRFLEQIANRETEEVLPLALPQVTDFVFSEPDPNTAPQTLLAEISQSTASPAAGCSTWVDAVNFDTVDSDPGGVTTTVSLDPCPTLSFAFPDLVNVTTIQLETPGRYRIAGTVNIANSGSISPDSVLAAVPAIPGWGASRFNFTDRLVQGTVLPADTVGSGDSFDFDFIFDFTAADLSTLGTLHIFVVGFGSQIWDAGATLSLWKLDELEENDTYDIRDTLPDVTAMNLFAAIVKAFNFKVYTDEINRRVFADPPELFYDKGDLPDLTDQINREESFSQERISPNKNGLRLEWAKDDEDALHEAYVHPQQGLIGDELPLGSRIILPDIGSEYETVKIEEFAGTFNDYLVDEGGIHVLWFRVPEADTFLKFEWFPRIVQVQDFDAPQTLYIQSNEPVDGTCSGSFTSTAVGSVFTTPFTTYVRGFFAGTLPVAPESPNLPSTKPKSTLSFYSTSGLDNYERYYKNEREATEEIRKVTTQLLLNKGRTIEEFIRYNTYWKLEDQIARIDAISKHSVGLSDKIEANFTILKGLTLPEGEPYVPTALTQATRYDGSNDFSRFLGMNGAFVVANGDNMNWNIWYRWNGAPPGPSHVSVLLDYWVPSGGLTLPRFRAIFYSTYLRIFTLNGSSPIDYPYATYPELVDGSRVMLTISLGGSTYINNVSTGLIQPKPNISWSTVNPADVTIPTLAAGFSGSFNSPLDVADLRCFNGPIAASDRIAMWNAGLGDSTWQPSNQLAHIVCNQPVNPQVDSSGNSKDLTLYNMPTPPLIVPFP